MPKNYTFEPIPPDQQGKSKPQKRLHCLLLYPKQGPLSKEKRGTFKLLLVPMNPMYYSNDMNELIFEVTQESDGGFVPGLGLQDCASGG